MNNTIQNWGEGDQFMVEKFLQNGTPTIQINNNVTYKRPKRKRKIKKGFEVTQKQQEVIRFSFMEYCVDVVFVVVVIYVKQIK